MSSFFDLTSRYQRNRDAINEALARVFQRGSFILGPELEEFESRFARYLGIEHVVGVNSGTDALFLSLKACEIGEGHEVITVANTAVPTVSAIRMTGATPVFVDVQEDTQTLDPSLLDAAVNKRTRAIIPVHLYGYPADMSPIMDVARKHRLTIIEDACQAHGAKYSGAMVGTLGRAGCFSFYPTKNLGAFGDAGAIATSDARFAVKLRALRNYGEVAKYRNSMEGVNSRLDEIQAAILSWGLTQLDHWNEARAKLAAIYLNGLRTSPLELPRVSDQTSKRVWHLFVIKCDRRDELRRHLSEMGLDTMVHYPVPIHRQAAYRFLGYKARDLPKTTRLSRRILSLPIYPELTMAHVNRICSAVRDFYG